jgi:hypothetical protein
METGCCWSLRELSEDLMPTRRTTCPKGNHIHHEGCFIRISPLGKIDQTSGVIEREGEDEANPGGDSPVTAARPLHNMTVCFYAACVP